MRSILRPAVIAIGVTLLSSIPVQGVTVMPLPRRVWQPDGSTLTVVPHGDEFNVFWELPSGHTVVRDQDGWWRLARLDSDGRLAAAPQRASLLGAETLRSLRPHLRPTQVGHASGELAPVPFGSRTALRSLVVGTQQPLLVILVEFTDRAPIGAAANDFQQAFFGSGRSVASYYHDVTFGAIGMEPAVEGHGAASDGVVGWLKLAMKHPNRGIAGSDSASESQKEEARHNTRLAVKAAIEAANPYVDFSAYDRDGDGGISSEELGVVVVMAGWESSYGGYRVTYNPASWGHSWALGFEDEVGTVAAPVVDGVRVGHWQDGGGYVSFGEWMQTSRSDSHRSTIGVMVHELGHDPFGLPDLYDYDDSSLGVGGFCLMGSGSWGSDLQGAQWFSGDAPVALCAWSKLAINVIEPTDLQGAGTTLATPASESPVVYRLGTGVDNEYFLLEYRSPTGWDAGLKRWDSMGFAASGGLAIWHVDEYADGNDDEQHKMVDLEEANGLNLLDLGEDSAERTMLFYAGGTTRFDDATNPGAHRYDGDTATGVVIDAVGTAEPSGISLSYVAPNQVGFAADHCVDAVEFTLEPGQGHSVAGSLVQASGGDTPQLCVPLTKTAWYRVTPLRSGRLSVDTSGFDTVAAVLAGSCGDFAVLGCNDDIDSTGASHVGPVPLRRGEEVFVVIGRYGNGRSVPAPLAGQIGLAAADPLQVSVALPSCAEPTLTMEVRSGGVPLAGLAAGDLHVLMDGSEVPVTDLTAMPDGSYRVDLDTRFGLGSYHLRVEVDTATASGEAEATIPCPGAVRRRLDRGS